jgi:hypothetical protein
MQKQKISLKIECHEKGSFKTPFFFKVRSLRSQHPKHPFSYLFTPFSPLFGPQSSPNRAQTLCMTPTHLHNHSAGEKFTLEVISNPKPVLLAVIRGHSDLSDHLNHTLTQVESEESGVFLSGVCFWSVFVCSVLLESLGGCD